MIKINSEIQFKAKKMFSVSVYVKEILYKRQTSRMLVKVVYLLKEDFDRL